MIWQDKFYKAEDRQDIEMKVGIKFCGGCNPRYDRRKALTELQNHFSNIEWVTDNAAICDYWLVACGCARECVDVSKLIATKKVLVLANTMDYRKATEELITELKQHTGISDEKKTIQIGEIQELSLKVDEDYVLQFAKMTGDYNKLHMDETFAKEQWFGKRVAHGMIGSNLLAAVLGTKMPGDGAILLSMDTEFCQPIQIGDTITAHVVLESVTENKKCYIGTFKGWCKNEIGDCLIKMQARQMMMKNIFIVTSNET